MTNLEKLYNTIAKEKQVTRTLVETIFKSQFELVKKTMEEGKDTPVRLERFGVFRVKPRRRDYVNIINKNKTENNERNETDRRDIGKEI